MDQQNRPHTPKIRPGVGRRPMPARRPEVRAASPEVRAPEVRAPEAPVPPARLPGPAERAQAGLASIARAASLGSIPAAPSQHAALPAAAQSMVNGLIRPEDRPLGVARGYQRQDLYAVAEIGYHYLFSGGLEIARALFEGLVAVAPDEAYFALALGLTHDHLQEQETADRWYAKAAQLDPHDPRADVNRAELRIERKDFQAARTLLMRGVKKARIRQEWALERKATALLGHLERASNR